MSKIEDAPKPTDLEWAKRDTVKCPLDGSTLYWEGNDFHCPMCQNNLQLAQFLAKQKESR